jgi:hypothetical protein
MAGMRSFVPSKAAQQTQFPNMTPAGRTNLGQHDAFAQRRPNVQVDVQSVSSPSGVGAGHDFSRIPVHSQGGSTRSGLAPGETENNSGLAGGVFDTLRDIGDVISTGVGNIFGGAAALLTGIDINTADTSAPAWNPHGDFNWRITWNMSGRNVGPTTNGWLVQKVENTYSGQDSAGAAITNARVGATPSYHEAWPVVAGAVQSPWGGPSRDVWARPNLSVWPAVADARTKGRWSMLSKAYFTTTDPTAHGMAPHNVADAGDLPSSVSAPPNLGVTRLHRYAHGTWDSTGAAPRHSGGNR